MTKRFSLNKADLIKWSKNALIFAGPAILVLLASFTKIIPSDWQYGALVLYIINLFADLLRKYISGK